MNLSFDTTIAKNYKNNAQIARVLTEDWVKKNGYCLNCNALKLQEFKNNLPVADFYCDQCHSEYELKSKKGNSIGNKINDGAYSTMIERINSNNNPHFFFLSYDKTNWTVNNFLIIPKYYFVLDTIQKRKPLASTARRAGWVGCNIDLRKVPSSGRIFLVKNAKIIPQKNVRAKWKETFFLNSKHGNSKGWILDIMNCIDSIQANSFSLKEMYQFEAVLKVKYPKNNFIKDKIRQQLQLLRDKGLIEFNGRGNYTKLVR